MELMTVEESDPDPDVKLIIQVAFCEVGGTMGKPVVATLKQFSSLCTNIVNANSAIARASFGRDREVRRQRPRG